MVSGGGGGRSMDVEVEVEVVVVLAGGGGVELNNFAGNGGATAAGAATEWIRVRIVWLD